jgi:hypothetical protein
MNTLYEEIVTLVKSFMLEENMGIRKEAYKTYFLITLNGSDVHFIPSKSVMQ